MAFFIVVIKSVDNVRMGQSGDGPFETRAAAEEYASRYEHGSETLIAIVEAPDARSAILNAMNLRIVSDANPLDHDR